MLKFASFLFVITKPKKLARFSGNRRSATQFTNLKSPSRFTRVGLRESLGTGHVFDSRKGLGLSS